MEITSQMNERVSYGYHKQTVTNTTESYHECDTFDVNLSEVLQKLKDTVIEKNKSKDEDLEEKDWRDMSDDEWSKLLNNIDNYLENFKENLEKLKELQNKAAMEAAAGAPAGQTTLAVSNAALQVAANGFVSSNDMAKDALSKTQEILLTGDTTPGISNTENVKECASVDDESEKIWTITAFTSEGIICTESKGGITKELWRMDYKNNSDAQRVWDFLDKFDKDTDLKFSGSMKFWEDFLAGLINEDEIITQYKK